MQEENHTPPEDAPQTPVDTGGEALQDETLVDAVEDEIQTLQTQIAKLKDSFIRERAENDNLRKRHERDLQNAHKYSAEKLVKDLLPVMDSLTLGLEAAKAHEQSTAALAQFIEGSEMTLKLLLETLKKHGVEELNPVGEKFNPELHQALSMIADAAAQPNTVLQVAQKGYLLNGRVIRAAQVLVAKAP